MKKDEFLETLAGHLDVLTESALKAELDNADHVIQQHIQNGLTEEDAVKSLGSVEEIQHRIYTNRGIDINKVVRKKGYFFSALEELFQIVHNLVDVMGKNDAKSNVKIIIEIIILLLFIALIKIPFILVRNLGDNVIQYLNVPYVSNIWGILIDIIYIVIAVIAFINIFNRYFKNIKQNGKKNDKKGIKGNELESISLEDK